jgi:hypothetical protein
MRSRVFKGLTHVSRWLGLVCALGAAACSQPCNRSGCDAYARPATAAAAGIAGILVYESDSIGNGCQECGFATGEIQIWATPTLIADEATAAARVLASPATFTVMANGRYERALDPGTYLVCASQGECAAVTVPAAGRVTVNVRQINGPFSLAVFEPGSSTRRTTGIFAVPMRERLTEPPPPPPGAGSLWLVSTEASLTDPKAIDQRPLIEIEGTLTAIDAGEARPPKDWRVVFDGTGGTASHVLTIRSGGAAPIDWKLGYRLAVGAPATDIDPDFSLAVGDAVHLKIRFIWGFGTAPAFVLSDARGIALAIDLAVYGDPLRKDDVPGLVVGSGASVGVQRSPCGDLRYTKLVFTADTAVEVDQSAISVISIKGTRYSALNLFNFVPAVPPGAPSCPDAINEARAWAIWRRP